MEKIKLLLVEDDANLGYMIKSNLEDILEEYEVRLASNGAEGLEELKSFAPDVIVSDVDMPVMTGLEMVKKIRQTHPDMPIVFASGKISSKDVKQGFNSGVDNYIKKPFTHEEIDVHIKALLNLKAGGKQKVKNAIHKIGNYMFDPKNFSLTYNDSEKKIMTAKESQILAMLFENKGEIVRRDDIIEKCWEKTDPVYASRSLDVFITKLRGYLSKDTSITIKNIKSTGLILDFD